MTVAPGKPAAAPPKGYRPHMPLKAILEAAIRLLNCPRCGEKLGRLENLHRDHDPPLAMRCWDPDAQDTIPPANDPRHIVLMHKDCHVEKTTGGATKARARGDITEISRTKTLAAEQEQFRSRMLAKAPGERAEKPKSKWPKRPMRGKR